MWSDTNVAQGRSRAPRNLINELNYAFRVTTGQWLESESVALLDFPVYANVGDAAIWCGEIAWLAGLGKKISYCCSLAGLEDDALARIDPSQPILLSGGGNFGDIWEHHQKFREHVLTRFRDRRIVQLPQSIHFRCEARADQTARIIEQHPAFVLLVRDVPSLEFARRKFQCEVYLCPDAAFQLGVQQPGVPLFDVLALLREDEERVLTPEHRQLSSVRTEDWLTESRMLNRARAAVALVSGSLTAGSQGARLHRFNAVAGARVRRGLDQLSRGRAIVTDRLHGHILSTLLGRPQALLDNEYGKIGRFLDAFSGGTDLTFVARSLSEAIEWARAQSCGAERAA